MKKGKERIIDAAFNLFLKNGYKGVSLKDIINESELSRGAIYHHFDSKYAIYLAAIEKYFCIISESLDLKGNNLAIKERLRRKYKQFLHIFEIIENIEPKGLAYPIRTYYIFQLESEKDALILERIEKTRNHFQNEVTEIIQTAIDNDEITTQLSISVIVQQLMSMMQGIALHHSTIKKDCKKELLEKFDEVIIPYLEIIITQN